MPILKKRIVPVLPFSATKEEIKETKSSLSSSNPNGYGDDEPARDARKIIRPIVWTLRMFGLLSHFKADGKLPRSGKITRVYSAVILTLFWLNFFRFFSAYQITDLFGPSLFTKVLGHAFYMLCIVNATCLLLAGLRDGRLAEFMRRWTRLLEHNVQISGQTAHLVYVRKMSRRVWAITIAAWITLIINVAYTGYLLFCTVLLNSATAPLSPPHSFSISAKAVYLLLTCYLSAAWYFPPALFLVVCSVISEEFALLAKDFRHAVKTNKDIGLEIEPFRRRHQEICRLVESADDALRLSVAGGISLNIFIGMLVLYIVVWYDLVRSDVLFVGVNVFWITTVFSYLAVIAAGGGMVNHEAHAPAKDIYDIGVESSSAEYTLQMSMFLNKLTCGSIGLTAMDLFVIDKPAILAITGAFLTYFVVLIQFHQPLAVVPVLNCSQVLAE